MKKIIIIMGIFSLFGCDKNRKIYSIDNDFNRIEKKMKISKSEALKIYDDSFNKMFDVKEEPQKKESFYRVIYIYIDNYYIGFASKNDKRDEKTAPLYFLAKINSETGEISVVK